MKVSLHIVARLVNPVGVWEDDVGCEIPDPSYKKVAITRALATINANGGLYRQISDDEVQFIPLLRVEDVNIKLSTVALADNLDLARATGTIKLA